MIQTSISTEKLLLWLILVVVIANVLLKRCDSTLIATQKPSVTVTKDTIWQTKTDTFTIQTVRYKTVYVNADNPLQKVDATTAKAMPEHYTAAKAYTDTLSNDDIDIFSYNLVQGTLLDSKLSYTLKVPRQVTVTNTIRHPKTYRSGLYLFSEIGGNQTQFNNLSLGLQYNRKGKWFASYRYNLKPETASHHLGVGVRLFK